MRILLIGVDEVMAASLDDLVRERDASAEVTIGSADAEEIETADVWVVVLGPMLPVQNAFELAARVAPFESGREVIVVTADISSETLRQAMRLGVRDVLSTDTPFPEIASAVALGIQTAGYRRARLQAAVTQPTEREQVAKVITVFAMKGGVGKSVVATNIAVGLAKGGARVALLDLALQSGDCALMLQLEPKHTIFDAVQFYDKLDAGRLESLMVVHKTGVRLLPAPLRPEEAESINGAAIGKIIGLLKGSSDYLVIDTPTALNEVVLTALAMTDEVFSVVTMDVPSLKSLRVCQQELQQLGMDPARTRLVLNRSDSRVGLQVPDVEGAGGCPVAAQIPSDKRIPIAVNKGEPVILDAPHSHVARSIAEIVKMAAAKGGGGRVTR